MSAALSIFKLGVQSVRQLQLHTTEVSFKMTGLPYQWTPMANYSTSIARQSPARLCWSVLACIASQYHTPNGLRSGDLNISEVIFKSESQF